MKLPGEQFIKSSADRFMKAPAGRFINLHAERFIKSPAGQFIKERRYIVPAPVYIEMGVDTFRALQENEGLELPLERLNNGRLSDACRENLAVGLKAFLKREKWQLPARAICAIAGTGLSLRRLVLPPAPKSEWQRLLLLQIETEFPLSPDELAWGCRQLSEEPAHGAPVRQEFMVAAVRKEVLEDYSSALANCGVRPVFTLAALARSRFCPVPDEPYSILDLDSKHSEWIAFENNIPAVLRIFPWGTDNFAATEQTPDAAIEAIRSQPGRTLFLTGAGDRHELVAALARKLGDGINCRRVEAGEESGWSAGVFGVRQWAGMNGGVPSLTLRTKPKRIRGVPAKLQLSDPVLRQRALVATVLLIGFLVLPYAQALLLKPYVAHKVAAIQSQQGRLTTIDRELTFLQYLKENSPPYLDALYLFGTAAPPGTRLDSVTMNKHGEVSLSGSFGSFQQVVDFRTKLIQSGFFSTVSVDEQVPAQQKLNVRMTAVWKPVQARERLSIGPSAAEIAQATNGPASPKLSNH
ncbi:MAG TPA: hypothetical protein VH280_11540 [Verrucomicrobiae bacterium]|jgi:hypothetical protein|nr:hypothetical protein [Verrucomicrobiae bacterium]